MPPTLSPTEVALGMIELSSIARGITCADAIVKKAPVRILQNHPISPGKFLIVFVGGVAEVEESLQAGLSIAQTSVVDRLFLAQAHEQLAPLIAGAGPIGGPTDAAAILETTSAISAVLAADAAAKAAAIMLLDLRLGQGLGGKGFFTMTGDLESIEAAVAAGQSAIDPRFIVGVEIIPRPHEDLHSRLMW
jgi:microcompartment protein CcmL/EutN